MPKKNVAAELEALAGYLRVLGHPRRLEVLSQLRVPRALGEIKLRPWRRESEGNPERALSRNAVERHVALLRTIGVVASRSGERDGRKVEEYSLSHARLFQVVEELRDLAQLRPRDPLAIDVTEASEAPAAAPTSSGPHLRVLSGPFEGRVHELGERGPWTVGRSAGCEIALDYDPYVSSAHAVLDRRDGRFIVKDLRTNRNGTLLNWRPIPRGAEALLEAGDVLRLGRSLLLFRGA